MASGRIRIDQRFAVAGRRLRAFLPVLVASALLGTAAAPSASAAPAWQLDVHHAPSNFPPGGTGEYWFDLANVGDAPSSGPVELTIKLPGGGLTRSSVRTSSGEVDWSCPGGAGELEVVCTTTSSIPAKVSSRTLILAVDVAPGAEGDRYLGASVEGGGAAGPATSVELTHISSEQAGFGIVPGSFTPAFLRSDAVTRVRDAGAHPDLVVVPFDLNTIDSPTGVNPLRKEAAESLRDLQVDLPPGLVGIPTAVGECTPVQLTVGACPVSSQVGRVDARTLSLASAVDPYSAVTLPLYNMSSPRGALADLAFQLSGSPVHLRAYLDPGRGYALGMAASNVNETVPALDLEITLWGVPADPQHDVERCPGFPGEDFGQECETDLAPQPFLTLPSRCDGGGLAATLRDYDSWPRTGVFGPDLSYQMSEPLLGCDALRFEPSLEVSPSGRQTETPTGLDLRVSLPQSESASVPGTPPAKRIVVRLPEGMALSPAAAEGLGACTPQEIGLGTNAPVACPDAARIGTVTLSTQLLPEPLDGTVYLASQGDNPFAGLLAIYLVLHDVEDRGVLLKIPGRVDLDTESGRITASFDDLPQFPFESLALGFRSGPKAPLVNPPTCGPQMVAVELSSYARPDDPVAIEDSYSIEAGPGGIPCSDDEGSRPFAPRIEAGTVNPVAGAHTPFVLRLDREDRDQGLGEIGVVLPPGLVANLSGIPLCPEASMASVSSALGGGQAELDAPSCPAASQVGTVAVGAGPGAEPIFLPGRIYLAGPYRGAPFSLQAVVPVVAGPFDLGALSVRMALHMDPRTAQVRVLSDPLPAMVAGVPLDLRSLRLNLSRAGFIRNPTDCRPTAVSAVAGSLQGATAPLSTRFQVGSCANLAFAPALAVRSIGPTHRGAHPKLRAILTGRPGDAGIRRASLILPETALLDSRHIGSICTRAEFAARRCPRSSIHGHVKILTPLLDRPLEGPLYLRAGSNRLPDLAATVGGQVDLELAGGVDAVRGRLRVTLQALPDVPLGRVVLTLAGGRKGLIVNSGGVCAGPARARAAFLAQSGKVERRSPMVRAMCG